jgi:hypothetical protein
MGYLPKTLLLTLCSGLFLTACYPAINESDLPKNCADAKDAILTAEYFLAKKFGNKIFEQRPYQFEKNENNSSWKIRGVKKVVSLGGDI